MLYTIHSFCIALIACVIDHDCMQFNIVISIAIAIACVECVRFNSTDISDIEELA